MMYCLRSYIPLLLLPIPLSLSPVHFVILLSLTYMLNRPCLYCSLLLIILFATSSYWAQTGLIDFTYVPTSEGGAGYATWFLPRTWTTGANLAKQNGTDETLNYLASAVVDTTVAGMTAAAAKIRGRNVLHNISPGYLSSTASAIKELFRREWVIPCIGARVML